MKTLSFKWFGRFGHFRRAEANREGLTYPIPPRTAVLGLMAAVLGLEKDKLSSEFANAMIAVSGSQPVTFRHRVKLRKDPPNAVPMKIKRGAKGTTKPEKATLMNFEIMWNPAFIVDVLFNAEYKRFDELCERIRQGMWHFSPCLGLSEFAAILQFKSLSKAESLPKATYQISSCCPEDYVVLRPGPSDVCIHLDRLPYVVDEKRCFKHRAYYIEKNGQPFTAVTEHAWRIDDRIVVFA